MNSNNIDNSSLAMLAFSEIPQAAADAKQITALVKQSGTISGYQLSDGSIVDKEQGISMAKQGQISGVGVATNQGNEYLKSLPDAAEGNNLGSLPTISNLTSKS